MAKRPDQPNDSPDNSPDNSPRATDLAFLNSLEDLLRSRMRTQPGNSYVAQLLKKHPDAVLQKVGEEATEFILAAKSLQQIRQPSHQTTDSAEVAALREAAIFEMSDLWFHSMVALTQLDLSIHDVVAELEKRAQGEIQPTT